MGLSGFADVVIGLVLMYLVLSLICTTINEFVAILSEKRAETLSATIKQLIDNDELLEAFFKHGLIANARAASNGGSPTNGTAPSSYLDGHTFAMALLDSLRQTRQGRALAVPVPAADFISVGDIETIVGALPQDSRIRAVLLAGLATGKKDIAELRDHVAAWFDSAMDRLSGDYKRYTKWWSLGIGCCLAFAFNADSLSVGRALWGDEALRSQIVNAAAQMMNSPMPAECKPSPDDPNKPTTACLLDQLKTEQEKLRPFPIGWLRDPLYLKFSGRSKEAAKDAAQSAAPVKSQAATAQDEDSIIVLAVLKLLGCLWTGLALSLGAPFWFDVLQKVMNVRGTGPKPKRSNPGP